MNFYLNFFIFRFIMKNYHMIGIYRPIIFGLDKYLYDEEF